MKRVFIMILAFLIDYSLWIAAFAFMVTLTFSASNSIKTKEAEAQKIEEIYDAVSDVCELSGNVWSWEDKMCYRPEHLRRIHKVKPASSGLI